MMRTEASSARARGVALALAWAMVVSSGVALDARAAPEGYREQAVEVERERSGLLFGRFDADERLDMLVLGDASLALRLQQPDGAFADTAAELAVGQELGGALVDQVDLDGDGVSEIALLHADGVDVYAYEPEARAWVRRAEPLLEGMRGIRFLHLIEEDFIYDLDGDGDDDLVYPVDGSLYLYSNDDGVFVRKGEIDTPRSSVQLSVGSTRLAGLARARIRVPRLRIERDARDQSRLEFRLSDGRYVRTRNGSSFLDGEYTVERGGDDPLERFKRRHGIELAENESLQALSRDLDEDGIPDYTLVYKNRIWVYRGTKQGFDFDQPPDQLVKVSAADRTSALLLPLNDDARPDLVLFKYRIPSVGRMVAALAIGLRAEVEVLGYHNDGDPVFSRRPDERATLVLRVPPLLRLLGELEDVVQAFRDIWRPMHAVTSGDFDGDGRDDVLRLSGENMEIYLTRAGESGPIDLAMARGRELLEQYEGYRLVRRVLFEQRKREVTIEGAMDLASDVVNALQSAIVGDRQPELRLRVQPEAARRVAQILSQDLNGDTRDDVIVYVEPDREKERKSGVTGETQTLYLWLSDGEPDARPADSGASPEPTGAGGRASLRSDVGAR